MKKPGRSLIPGMLIAVAALLLAACFAVSSLSIERYAREDCFDSIEEATIQAANMFRHTLAQSREHLMLFSKVLAANVSTSEDLMLTYMRNFCDTQNYAAVCIHTADGREASYGADHPHAVTYGHSFEEEAARVPYVSDVIRMGEGRSQRYICQAVPGYREGEVHAILYGYIPLDVLPQFTSSTAYDGACEFYIVDGSTGDFLMDEYHRYDDQGQEVPLYNLYDGSLGERESMPGYRMEDMIDGIVSGKTGYHVFRSQRTGVWYYTYYMPLGVNNWSMQLTLDEPTAFATYHGVRRLVLALMACVLLLSLIILAVVICQNRRRRKQAAADLHRADYINAVQHALITAHNNPDFVDRALKLVAREVQAETALLLTFSTHKISSVYYWPSSDKTQAMALIGRDLRETFPVLFDALASNEPLFCDEEAIRTRLSQDAREIFQAFDIRSILLVPIADHAGVLKGAVAAVNMMDGDPAMLQCVTRDFFMAITNLENHNIIRRMGEIDYLTGVKNRNSFEAESPDFETLPAESLWCVYVDVNGLHTMNNVKGHSAGDALLCAVAAAVKKIYGMERTYRLGGDEFVAFCTDSSHEAMMNSKYRFLDEMGRQGYSVSIGFEGTEKNENRIFDLPRLMWGAETMMYREKSAYYEKNGLQESQQRSVPPRPADAAMEECT